MGEVPRAPADARIPGEGATLSAALEPGWTRVELKGKLEPKYPARGRAGGRDLAIALVGDDIFATDDICSHAYAHLSDGELDGPELICPLHGGSFDVRTGEAIAMPCFEAIAAYPARRIEGEVYVQLPSDR